MNHEAQAPTCTEIGWDAYVTCSRCDYSTYAEKEALGHDEVNHEAQAPTCTAIGWDAYVTCSRCDYSTYAEKEALGHDMVSVDGKDATCTEAGYTAYTDCSRCDHIEGKEVLKATGHVNTEVINAKAATCGAEGYTGDTYCNDCQTTIATGETIEATGNHNYTWTTTTAATCVATGVETGDCSCGATTTREIAIDSNAHNLVSVEAKAATCTEKGWEAYEYCDREDCNHTTYVEIPATEHSDSETDSDHICDTCNEVMSECSGGTATCEKKAVCTVCGAEYGDLADHTPGEAVEENRVESSCTDAGSYDSVVYCSVCKTEISRNEVALELNSGNHVNKTEHDRTDATCTANGYTAGTYCEDCKTWISGHEEIPAGHSIVQGEAQTKTCTQDGWAAYEYCTECDYTTKVVIPAGHGLSDMAGKDKTCTEAGYTAHKACSDCDYTEGKEVILAGHTWNDGVVAGDLKTYSCTADGCGATKTEVVEGATGDEDKDVTVVPDTPEEDAPENMDSVTIGKELLDQIAANAEHNLHLDGGLLDLLFDNAALKKVLETHATATNISIVVTDKTNDRESSEPGLLFDISLVIDSGDPTGINFGEGKVTVTIPLGELVGENQTVKVWYVERDEDGNETGRTEMTVDENEFNHDREKGHVQFKTNHFSEYEVVVVNEETDTSVTVTVDDKTNGNATIVAPEKGAVGNDYTITVTCDKACVVAYTTDNGATYNRVTAVAVIDQTNTYSFTVKLADGMDFVVRTKGDMDADGDIDIFDVTTLRKVAVGAVALDSDVQHAAYIDDDTDVDIFDVTALRKVAVKTISLEW